MADKSLYDLLKLAGEKIDSIVKSGTMTATYSGGITGTMTVPYIDFIDGTRIVWQPFNSSFNLAADMSAYGALYFRDFTVTLSQGFTNYPVAIAQGRISTGGAWLNCVNTTKLTITVLIIDVYKRVKGDNLRFQWLATGKWE